MMTAVFFDVQLLIRTGCRFDMRGLGDGVHLEHDDRAKAKQETRLQDDAE